MTAPTIFPTVAIFIHGECALITLNIGQMPFPNAEVFVPLVGRLLTTEVLIADTSHIGSSPVARQRCG